MVKIGIMLGPRSAYHICRLELKTAFASQNKERQLKKMHF